MGLMGGKEAPAKESQPLQGARASGCTLAEFDDRASLRRGRKSLPGAGLNRTNARQATGARTIPGVPRVTRTACEAHREAVLDAAQQEHLLLRAARSERTSKNPPPRLKEFALPADFE